MSKTAVCVVTGCSEGGLGFALTRALAHRKCTIIATVRRNECLKSLEELSTLYPDAIIQPFILDIRERESVHRCVKDILRQFNRIDILINNAGSSFYGSVADVSLVGFKTIMETNIFGMLNMTQEIVPHMKRQGYGQVINIGSIAGYFPIPYSGAYCATKCALSSLTSALRMELYPFGIQVSLVIPCGLETHITTNANKLAEQVQEQERTTLKESLLKSPQSSFTSMKWPGVPPCAEPGFTAPEPPPRQTTSQGSESNIMSKASQPWASLKMKSKLALLKRPNPSKTSISNSIEPRHSNDKITSNHGFPNSKNDSIADHIIYKILQTHQDPTTLLPSILWSSSNLFWYIIVWLFYFGLFLPSSFIESVFIRRFGLIKSTEK